MGLPCVGHQHLSVSLCRKFFLIGSLSVSSDLPLDVLPSDRWERGCIGGDDGVVSEVMEDSV